MYLVWKGGLGLIEDENHIFLECPIAIQLWDYVERLLQNFEDFSLNTENKITGFPNTRHPKKYYQLGNFSSPTVHLAN